MLNDIEIKKCKNMLTYRVKVYNEMVDIDTPDFIVDYQIHLIKEMVDKIEELRKEEQDFIEKIRLLKKIGCFQ